MKLSAMSYFGGKQRTKLNRWLNSLIPYEKETMYVEPFAGMLGVLLSRRPCLREIVNDLDGHIHNFWSVIRSDEYDKLARMIHFTYHCRQTYYDAREILFGDEEHNAVTRAWAVYVACQHGIISGHGKEGWGLRMVKTSGQQVMGGYAFAEKIQALHERMKNVQIDCRDAVVLLDRLNDFDHTVIYCDPPYSTADTSQYAVDKVDIDGLTDVLKKQKGRVAISGYGAEWDHLGWHKEELEVYYNQVGEHALKASTARTECLWMNYETTKQQALF